MSSEGYNTPYIVTRSGTNDQVSSVDSQWQLTTVAHSYIPPPSFPRETTIAIAKTVLGTLVITIRTSRTDRLSNYASVNTVLHLAMAVTTIRIPMDQSTTIAVLDTRNTLAQVASKGSRMENEAYHSRSQLTCVLFAS